MEARTYEEICSIIPNRYPMMILDSLSVGETEAVSYIVLKDTDWFFECHYPGNPILPLSLLLESMAQTFSATFLPGLTDKKEIPVIASMGEARLKEGAGPGDTIRIVAVLDSFRRGIAKGTCRAYKNEDAVPILEIGITDVIPSQMVRMK